MRNNKCRNMIIVSLAVHGGFTALPFGSILYVFGNCRVFTMFVSTRIHRDDTISWRKVGSCRCSQATLSQLAVFREVSIRVTVWILHVLLELVTHFAAFGSRGVGTCVANPLSSRP